MPAGSTGAPEIVGAQDTAEVSDAADDIMRVAHAAQRQETKPAATDNK